MTHYLYMKRNLLESWWIYIDFTATMCTFWLLIIYFIKDETKRNPHYITFHGTQCCFVLLFFRKNIKQKKNIILYYILLDILFIHLWFK